MPASPPVRTGARALVGPGLFVAVATAAANGLNAVFQVALARILSPAEYSLLVALVVVTLIAAVPPLAFQAAVAREVAVALAEGRRSEAGASIRDVVRGLVPWALSALAVGGAAAGALAAAGRGDAGATVGARVLLLVPIGVTTVLFPRVAVLRDRARERRHLLAGLGVVGLLGALTTAALWLAAGPLIRHVFGDKYAAAIPWLGPLSLAMALYALATVYVYHFLSLARGRFALVLVGIFAAQLAAFAALHGRPADLIGVQ